MITQWLTFLALMLAIGLWLGAMRGRERALRASRNICQAEGVQLLDETVGLAGARLRRHHDGLHLEWRYAFEVSLNGNDRHAGHLWMSAGRVVGFHTTWPTEPAGMPQQADPRVIELLTRVRQRKDDSAT